MTFPTPRLETDQFPLELSISIADFIVCITYSSFDHLLFSQIHFYDHPALEDAQPA